MFSPFTWCFYNAVDDGYESFAVVSEYFGRNLFNKLTVVTEPPELSKPALTPATTLHSAGQNIETKLKLDGQSRQESRTQFVEQQLYSASLEDKETKLEPQIHTKNSPFIRPSDASKREAPLRNPFDETYDESKNPFADETINDPTNPFAGDDDDYDDYDKNLNPFS
ncbi:uncharacterized protein LOC126771688 [Nymphalis io]|uniref:uncharacterized protein LOC126771688 n=1 Tax=Inachis io TaxID=171585 RepID=UPI0021696E34|nr:uncharacterized protein LOC126771688 [Nymphalis io]